MEGDYSVGSELLQVVHNLALPAMCAMRFADVAKVWCVRHPS